MSKVIVMYETGRIWSCEVDAVGDGDAGEICAAAGTVELLNDALVFKPTVMPWKDGAWRSPTGIVDEWTNSTSGFVDWRGGRHDMRGGSAYSQHGTVEETYTHSLYILRSPKQLEGAVSVTVDGILAYCKEGGRLVSAIGSDRDDEGGREDEPSTFHQSASIETRPDAIYPRPGITFQAEVM